MPVERAANMHLLAHDYLSEQFLRVGRRFWRHHNFSHTAECYRSPQGIREKVTIGQLSLPSFSPAED
jgi:hypothetical protein